MASRQSRSTSDRSPEVGPKIDADVLWSAVEEPRRGLRRDDALLPFAVL